MISIVSNSGINTYVTIHNVGSYQKANLSCRNWGDSISVYHYNLTAIVDRVKWQDIELDGVKLTSAADLQNCLDKIMF